MDVYTLFGPLDFLARDAYGDVMYAEVLLLALVILNMALRARAHGVHAAEADEGEENVDRYLPLEVANVLLLVSTFYYATLEFHAGVVLSTLVLGLFVADVFEFEARKVEARKEDPLERPKAAIAASFVVLLYVAYKSLFVFVEPLWRSVV